MARFLISAPVRLSWAVAVCAFGVCLPGPLSAQNQASDTTWSRPPIAGSWEPVESLGQPSRFRALARLAYGSDRKGGGDEAGPLASVGLYRDFFNPVYGALGASLHGYFGQRGEDFDGGLQLFLESPSTFLHAGLDWNPRLERLDPALGVTFPLRRGGWPLPGSQFRLDWIPGRARSLTAGFTIPLGRPSAGRTRKRIVDVELPAPPRTRRAPRPEAGSGLEALLGQVGESMDALAGLQGFFWLDNFSDLDPEATVRETRAGLIRFRDSLTVRADRAGDGLPSYPREVEAYHADLAHALGLAIAGHGPDAAKVGRPFADRLRRFALDEVVFPYNRAIGQFKQPDRLDGLAARARARFVAWMELESGASPEAVERALTVADEWFRHFDRVRARMSRLKNDTRMQWIPLALALRPEEHDTQEEVDALIERALARPFEAGNEVVTIDGVSFQDELRRTILETEHYHVLWVHDYRGRNALGEPDRVGFEQTVNGYLRALLDRVRAYDETGTLPVYLLMVDQYFYEINAGRLWFDLLEDPLGHEMGSSLRASDLARSFDMEGRIRAMQDSLRFAVTGSRRLQAEARAFGEEWIRDVIKVHVNVTNPTDFSFRTRRLLRRGPPMGADNLMRDHRKIVIRDVSEDDPGRGEVLLSGVGVGEHYATPTWDDRALVVRGPAALEAKTRARDVLEQNGLGGDRLPGPLRPTPRGSEHGRRIGALEAAGATARVLQAHNRTGWGPKEATFLQMLIYDLAPPGTLIYVPDSLWSSREWMAQLVSAALRGCRVYVVAPSLANAPVSGFLSMSTLEELVTRLVLVGDVFGETIEVAGGELRVGLYTRRSALDDLPGLLTDVDSTFAANPFLDRIFPLSTEARTVLARFRTGASSPAVSRPLDDVVPRAPQMHRKTQLVVSASVLERISGWELLPDYLDRALRAMVGDEGAASDGGAVDGFTGEALVREMEGILASSEGPSPEVLYYLTGSLNKNVRSMALDGEVLAAVAGPWALQGYLDFLLLSGGVTWLDGVDDVHALLPPYPAWKRFLSRWFYRVI